MPSDKENSKREETIKKEAKLILDKFAKELSKIKDIPESFVERDKSFRQEGEGKEPDESFRQVFFQNAPEVNNDCIQAEKGKWK
jgi:hypothetical protein